MSDITVKLTKKEAEAVVVELEWSTVPAADVARDRIIDALLDAEEQDRAT
jgi:hypothetical protein